MSYRKSTLERPDAEFLALANNINRQSSGHSAEWHLDPDQVATLQKLVSNANTAYAANSDIALKNRTTSAAKKFAFSELKHFLGIYINALEGNLRVPDEAIALMELRPRVRHARQPLGLPTEAPVVNVVRQHDEITVYVSRAEHGQPAATVSPEKYGRFALRWKFEGETEYRTVISTRLHHTLIFEPSAETRRILLSAAFVNPRLQPGPWSDDITSVIG
ncbi:MAG: hypothetical protein LBJ47_01850 [Tannerella sp.]|jgi:hypothetical protein|nr:hypothetical protein [Tannerella sp.]